MMDIQPTDLRYFFETAQVLNISRASERLGVGQPAVSQAIQRLERVLGVSLFDRFKTGVQLTPAGRRLLFEGQKAMEIWEALKKTSRQSEDLVEGRYTLGCHTAVGAYSLPVFLKELLQKHPRLEIVLKHGLSREIVSEVIGFKVDFGLVMNPVKHPDLIIKYLCEDRVSCWKVRSAIEDTLIYDPALAQSQQILKKIEKAFKIKRHLTSSSLEISARLAAEGCGIAILPARIAALYPELQPINKSAYFVIDKLALVYRADRSFTASSRVIVDAIAKAQI